MPSSDPRQRFEDILFNIARIEEHIARIAERCLERISEAAKKLGPAAETLCPDTPWRNIRGLGNVLRHEYDLVESVRLWYVVQDDLPPLKAAVESACQRLPNDPNHSD